MPTSITTLPRFEQIFGLFEIFYLFKISHTNLKNHLCPPRLRARTNWRQKCKSAEGQQATHGSQEESRDHKYREVTEQQPAVWTSTLAAPEVKDKRSSADHEREAAACKASQAINTVYNQ